ncbi:ABC transporter substrate-binding protein [Xanthobacter tagetidis]|uniref:Sulfonate ABC transporter substrate-binding protein n=1 Tax=Xanthobacter tagetidis TaxID=60216 RepID=A0A3L7AKR6_9HYPH|nr:ABC transporter substrate-binding protein [Xanthobacter tagetidis]MBB6307418.1 sulfonate transport system substrate-binding protein [Xanthobacter tagetidis]RLP81009.1 sulfonate ABC transporter substrate-binding protein [Xanthobacter tagetidis]
MTSGISRRRFGQLAAGLAASLPLAAPSVLRAQDADLVRMCWFNTTTVSAQIAHVLMRTDIPARNGLKMEMIQLAASPAITEALVSGAGDVGTLSDFAAVTTMAIGAPVTTVSSQARFRSAVLATKKSGITKLADLKGKQVFGTFGITAFQNAQDAVLKAGLVPGKDMTFVNVGPAELADAVGSQRIDAFFTYDPFVSYFESTGHAVVISENLSPVIALAANNRFLQQKPDALKRLLMANAQALYFASQNNDMVNGWFRSLEPAKNIPEAVLQKASSYDPAWSAKKFTDIKVALSPEQIAQIETLGKWGFEQKLLPRLPDVPKFVNTAIAAEVDKEIAAGGFDVKSVKILRA